MVFFFNIWEDNCWILFCFFFVIFGIFLVLGEYVFDVVYLGDLKIENMVVELFVIYFSL